MSIKITTIKELWNSEKDKYYAENKKLSEQLDEIDEIFQGDLKAQVEASRKFGRLELELYNEQIDRLERLLAGIWRKGKSEISKEIRNEIWYVLAIFQDWVEKRSIFKDEWVNSPVTEKELQDLQDRISFPLPLYMVESYRICNGLKNWEMEDVAYINSSDLLFIPISKIISEYDSFQESATMFISDPVRKKQFDDQIKNWIPLFASNGNAWMLNCGPAINSKIPSYSVFTYNHEDGELKDLKPRYASVLRIFGSLGFSHEL